MLTTGLATGLCKTSLTGVRSNPLPPWKGFNLTDFFSPAPLPATGITREEHLKWMRDWGFNFIRIPVAYPCYLNFDRTRDIVPDEVYQLDYQAVDRIEELVQLALQYDMHVSLNLHRAPGYCINAGFHEPFDLWRDESAQQAFCFHWAFWARRFKQLRPDQISFDLVNEPSMRVNLNDQHAAGGPVPGALYRKVAQAAVAAIRKENPARLVIADGNQVGNIVVTELEDLQIAQSCRGYFPGAVSHYRAPWANKDPEHMALPQWPWHQDGKSYDKSVLEQYYQPWIDLASRGVGVHCGECGCWNKTPHEVFIAWFTDVLDILSAHRIGFCLWNFIGDFGILDSHRTDLLYENWYGHKLDRKLLTLLRRY